jgi:hypothetical protein
MTPDPRDDDGDDDVIPDKPQKPKTWLESLLNGACAALLSVVVVVGIVLEPFLYLLAFLLAIIGASTIAERIKSDDGSKDMKAQAVLRGYAHYEADPKTGVPIFKWNDNPNAPAPEKAARP